LGASKRFLEAIRGVGKPSILDLGCPSSYMRFCPFWVGEDNELRNWWQRCELVAQLEHEAVVKNLERGITSTLWFKFLPYSSTL